MPGGGWVRKGKLHPIFRVRKGSFEGSFQISFQLSPFASAQWLRAYLRAQRKRGRPAVGYGSISLCQPTCSIHLTMQTQPPAQHQELGRMRPAHPCHPWSSAGQHRDLVVLSTAFPQGTRSLAPCPPLLQCFPPHLN